MLSIKAWYRIIVLANQYTKCCRLSSQSFQKAFATKSPNHFLKNGDFGLSFSHLAMLGRASTLAFCFLRVGKSSRVVGFCLRTFSKATYKKRSAYVTCIVCVCVCVWGGGGGGGGGGMQGGGCKCIKYLVLV